MVEALAPRRTRVSLSLVCLLVLAGVCPLAAFGQAGGSGPDAKKGGPAAAKKDAGKAETKGEAGSGVTTAAAAAEKGLLVDPKEVKKLATVEVYKDPRAQEALDIEKFKALPAGRAPNRRDVMEMATGAASLNRETLQSWVTANAAALTDHRHLEALIDPKPLDKADATPRELAAHANTINSRAKAIEAAVDGLIEPITLSANNQRFRQEYDRILIATLPKLLDNHLVARTEAMIVLGLTGDPDALPVFVQQLNDPNQVMMVKLWAADGIANVAQHGKVKVEAGRANSAAKALSDYLQRESDTFWFAQMRALEALGSLRLATDTQGQNQCEMASTALKFLADPKAKPEVRATAAWALGMMNVPTSARYNYHLVAYHMGQAAAEMGDEVGSAFSSNPDRATQMAGLLVLQLVQAFRGDENVRDAGLQNAQGLGPARNAVTGIGTRVQDVGIAAFNLTSPATPSGEKSRRGTALASKVTALRDFLAKNEPSDLHLVPGGPEFPGPPKRVAGASATAR